MKAIPKDSRSRVVDCISVPFVLTAFGTRLLESVFSRHASTARELILITDTIPVKRERNAIEKTFKTFLRDRFANRKFAVFHHSSVAHVGLQTADYLTWALHRKWQRADEPSYALIKHLIRSEQEVWQV
jgi:hypothetical protein